MCSYIHNLQLFVTGVYSSLGIYDIHSYTQYNNYSEIHSHDVCVCVIVYICIMGCKAYRDVFSLPAVGERV